MNFLTAYADDSSDEGEEVDQYESHVIDAMPDVRGDRPTVTAAMPAPSSDDEDDDDYGPQPASQSSSNITNMLPPRAVPASSSEKGPIPTEDALAQYAAQKRIPMASEVNLTGHTKAVTCISIEPAGNRLVTGSLDYAVKIYDYGGMDSRHRAFQSIEVEENHPIVAISHSPSGDRFVVATGSAQPKVLDRDGKDVIKFIKGDMYLRDLSNTKGHTMEVTCVCWHPVNKNLILSSSSDGTLRVWDLLGSAVFGNLVNKHVLKTKNTTSRLSATSCCYHPDGQRIYGGLSDGSMQIWKDKKVFARPDFTIKSPSDQAIQSVVISPDSRYLAARHADGLLALWTLGSAAPVLAFLITDMSNIYPTANLAFSPDSSLLLACTSAKDEKARLHFFSVPVSVATDKIRTLHSSMSIAMTVENESNISAIAVKWHAGTNHIYCSLSNGLVRVLYDATMSTKGALMSSRKAPRRTVDPSDFAIGEIIVPNALPMFREDTNSMNKHLKRVAELKDPVTAKIPEKPSSSGPGSRMNTSFFFTEYATKGKKLDNTRSEDPRAALLKYAEDAKANPHFLGKAYETTQPKTQLSDKTFEQEQDDFKSKQRRLH